MQQAVDEAARAARDYPRFCVTGLYYVIWPV
jgi:hypothetical protein